MSSDPIVATQEEQLQDLREETVQSRARDERINGGFSILRYLLQGAYLIPPWWSEARDAALRDFWKKSDHLAGALYTMESKMSAIPFRVVSRDSSNRRWKAQAEERQETLLYNSAFGSGWQVFYPQFIEDMLSQDKGAFAEVIGRGDPTGPIVGAPIGVAHLDAARCTLTGNPVFPVLYRDDDGQLFKLHYTRVIHISQMTSPQREMNGVGVCAVSRCLNTSQNLYDILVYKQEKLGSRPHRDIIVAKGGLDPDDIGNAFVVADSVADAQGLSRYGKTVVVGERNLPDADLVIHSLSGLPDNFDEQTSVTLGMATIALAFGTDARELFPAMSAGATRADAVLQHLKQRGKGPGQILQAVTAAINYKFLPRHLRIEFEFQDDAEDRQSTEIRGVRAQRRERDIKSRISTARTERQVMLAEGEIDERQFELMELQDGRLVDGSDILTLFYTEGVFAEVLDLGVEDPDNYEKHAPEEMLPKIVENRSKCLKAQAEEKNPAKRFELMMAKFALDRLEVLYQDQAAKVMAETMALMDPKAPGANGAPGLPRGMEGDRLRRTDALNAPAGGPVNTADSLQPSTDDSQTVKEIEAAIEETIARINKELAGEVPDRSGGFMGLRKLFQRKGEDYDDYELPSQILRVPKPDVPVVNITIPEQPAPVVTVNVPEQPAPVVNVAAPNLPEPMGRKEIEALVVALKAGDQAPVVNVHVPEQPAPVVTISPVLAMPDTEETTEVIHDERGRVSKLVKRVRKLLTGQEG